ncbi:hypothetical protein BDA96_03G399600 [Sorghum bicolor]|uniref:Uncharacterized protein n=1 Tax=Sorghum bicolor TaxID=4558 RepID=A0A921RHR4_SORBI|nr:hypothetical protein BDA96_03G399600 [Sorghum bicolor]
MFLGKESHFIYTIICLVYLLLCINVIQGFVYSKIQVHENMRFPFLLKCRS